MKRLLLISILMLCVLPCHAAPGEQSKDERAIRAADAKGLKAAHAKDVEGAIASYAENAVWLPPNAPIAQGKAAIRAGWTQVLASPGFNIDWQITQMEVSRSHDVAYTVYSYQMSMQGADGKPINDRGKDLAVWKKQPDGSWKI